eukprot:TRINITY_DN13506_c0_g1_i1.p1 TRINITY_DN13506_c0_g1~~TRINITY_DN13506_c0_g1_i1.p1  ORF type:complete len:269 (+),score=78.74 TRINITY_DN13506_c0_g1_i1:60-866(+)
MNLDDVRCSTSGVARLEFMAQEELVTVIPNFVMDQADFLSGRFGPFNPPDPVSVPLWLALLLKESGRCRLVTPDWMSKESLQETLKNERESAEFQPLPFHYKEIAKLLCKWRADVRDCTEVERLLVEIDSLRDEKIRRGINKIRANNNGYKLTSLTAIEINTARSVMGLIMDTLQAYDSHTSMQTPPPLAGDMQAYTDGGVPRPEQPGVPPAAGDETPAAAAETAAPLPPADHTAGVPDTPVAAEPAPEAAPADQEPQTLPKRRRLRR